MKPAHAAGENLIPIDVARLQPRGRFIRAIVEHHRRTHADAAIAVDGGDIRPGHSIVRKALVERLNTHGLHALGHQFADWIIHHRRHYAGAHAETIRQVGSYVELAAADVDLAFRGFAEGHDSGVQAVDQRAQRYEVERTFT